MAASVLKIYPKLQATDPSRPSLADLPLEIVLMIIEDLLDSAQIIIIGTSGEEKESPRTGRMEQEFTFHPPPLHKLSAVFRLFRHMYRRSRLTLWGAHPHPSSRSYDVNKTRDIFYVESVSRRRRRRVPPQIKFQVGLRLPCGVFAGANRIATELSFLDINPFSPILTLRFPLNARPNCKEILFLYPVSGLEKANMSLTLMRPTGEDVRVWTMVNGRRIWSCGMCQKFLITFARDTSGSDVSTHGVGAVMVDERMLGGPHVSHEVFVMIPSRWPGMIRL
ncbi:hypothetical protein N657DRAFT_639509 [Parathielavia appendiculata]|uniref:Uncharacterized protein n=1 Tax=Parathielavia appendiculata TaxID=2587402 RepID=A0AAN6U9R6_9PEZI|nr:hypothetical protein N657DRAFT_639509 [Parathielavia appendiculata]